MQVRVGDIGTTFIVQVTEDCPPVAVDVSTATVKEITLKSPAVTKVFTAVNTTDGTDGRIQYTTVSGDIDREGNWCIQAKVEFAGGVVYYSESTDFRVVDPL